jgi:hypothetical protein
MPNQLLSGPVHVGAPQTTAELNDGLGGSGELTTDLRLETVTGLWARKGLWIADEPTGDDVDVRWLQGPSRFVDLRRPIRRPSFDGIDCWNDLQPEHHLWIATQDGFAGSLQRAGNHFRWNRLVELDPVSQADEAVMTGDWTTLVETGIHADFVEHWQRTYSSSEHCGALDLDDGAKGRALLVRCGSLFGWAKSAPEMENGLEIALGEVDDGRWTVRVSSLPYREGDDLSPTRSQDNLRTRDSDASGNTVVHQWNISHTEGNLDL